MKKYAIAIIVAVILGYIGMNSTTNKSSLLDKTNEYNNGVYSECFTATQRVWQQWIRNSSNDIWNVWQYSTDTKRYRASTDCWQSQRKLTPVDLYLTVPRALVDEGRCSISQSEDQHVEAKNGGMYATDLACKFESQGVYAPDYLDQMIEYKIESIWTDNLLGNFVILSFPDKGETRWDESTRWYFWHTVLDSGWEVGDVVTTWVRFAHANISGATTWWHTHIELRRSYDGVWQSVRYVTRGKERRLEDKRNGWQGSQTGSVAKVSQQLNTYYFTHYDLGVVAQNDSSPCHWASGKDLCYLQRNGVATMAITSDIRKQIGIQFGDSVKLVWDAGCSGTYQVEDEMNIRFRQTPWVLRPWTNFYIKWDLPGRPGWACTVTKL